MTARPCAPIDYDHLDRYTAGDDSVRRDILKIFRTQAASWLAEFDPSLPDEAWAALCHSLKGSARGIGAFALGDLAEEAEQMTAIHLRADQRGASSAERPSSAFDLHAQRQKALAGLHEALDTVQAEIDRIAA